MKKLLINYGGIILFYLVVAFSVIALCNSFSASSRKSSSNINISIR